MAGSAMRVRRWAWVLYLAASLPLMLVFALNGHARFVTVQTVAHWASKVRSPAYVFCGDSITAGGKLWGARIHWSPLCAINLAGNGYTARQVKEQIPVALKYRPQCVFIMAGTNDLFSPDYNAQQTASTIHEMVDTCLNEGSRAVVTLVPHQVSPEAMERTRDLNARIVDAVGSSAHVIDLNPELAPDGVLLAEYAADPVHLSEAAYAVWVRKIRELD